MKPTISVILLRTKTKTHQQKFEAAQRYGPLPFLYLSKTADAKLKQPRAITVTLEPAATDIPDTAPLAATQGADHVRGTVPR